MAYRRLKKEDPAKSYNGLLDIMDRHLVLAQQRKNRSAQVRANNQRNASTTAAPGVCRKFLLGKCGNKNCNQEHPSGQGGALKSKSQGGGGSQSLRPAPGARVGRKGVGKDSLALQAVRLVLERVSTGLCLAHGFNLENARGKIARMKTAWLPRMRKRSSRG